MIFNFDFLGVLMARKKRKRNASRGSVNNIILKTLTSGDKYGYEIIKEVEEYSEGKIQLKQPSLYSSLSRFEEKKFVSSYWGDSDIGGRRHYYHLTDEGMAYYKKFVLKEEDVVDNETEEPIDDVLENNNILLNSHLDKSDEDLIKNLQKNRLTTKMKK
jgi:PadR family transcriptional regulator PadR